MTPALVLLAAFAAGAGFAWGWWVLGWVLCVWFKEEEA